MYGALIKALSAPLRTVPQNTCVVHAIWAKAVHLRGKMIVNRVPSELSLADSPFREHYRLIEELGGSFCEPSLDPRFRDPVAWEGLSSRYCLLSGARVETCMDA